MPSIPDIAGWSVRKLVISPCRPGHVQSAPGRVFQSAQVAVRGRALNGGRAESSGRPVQSLVLIVPELDLGSSNVVFKLLHAGCARDRSHRGAVDNPGE